jgi:uncharacterized protein (DUF433 family)
MLAMPRRFGACTLAVLLLARRWNDVRKDSWQCAALAISPFFRRFERHKPNFILAGPRAYRVERRRVNRAGGFDWDRLNARNCIRGLTSDASHETRTKQRRAPTIRQIGRYIVADPQVCHGKLTFRGTRIFVSDVLEQVERGLPWDTIVEEWYGKVPQEAIADAVRLARESFLEHAAEYSVPAGHRKAG